MCECSSSRQSTTQRIQLDEQAQLDLVPRAPAPPQLPPLPAGDVVMDEDLPSLEDIHRRCGGYMRCIAAARDLAQLSTIEQSFRVYDGAIKRICLAERESWEAEEFYRDTLNYDEEYSNVKVALRQCRIQLSIAQAATLPFSDDAPLPAPNMSAIGFRMVNPDHQELRPFVQWVRTGTAPAHLNCQEGVVYALASAGRVTREKIAQVLQITEATRHVQWDDRVFATQWTALQDQSQPIPGGAVVVFGDDSGGHIALHLGGGRFFSIWGAHDGQTVVTLAELLRHTGEMNGKAKFGTGGTLLS